MVQHGSNHLMQVLILYVHISQIHLQDNNLNLKTESGVILSKEYMMQASGDLNYYNKKVNVDDKSRRCMYSSKRH